MNPRLRQRVRRRAGDRCEYCCVPQAFDLLPHHVDHVIARKHRGSDAAENLCLACANCSLAKGPNISGRDPRTGRVTRLFHPRTDAWPEHFRYRGPRLVGRTPVGRTTVAVLNMNRADRVALRQVLIEQGDLLHAEDE